MLAALLLNIQEPTTEQGVIPKPRRRFTRVAERGERELQIAIDLAQPMGFAQIEVLRPVVVDISLQAQAPQVMAQHTLFDEIAVILAMLE